MAHRFFPYDFDLRFLFIWRAFGVKPGEDGVTLTDDGSLVATYGRSRVETSLANIKTATSTGPYRWWKAVGLRASAVDSGITFGTSPRSGVCLLFNEPIPQVVPPRPSHAGLTVTVADSDGLVRAIGQP